MNLCCVVPANVGLFVTVESPVTNRPTLAGTPQQRFSNASFHASLGERSLVILRCLFYVGHTNRWQPKVAGVSERHEFKVNVGQEQDIVVCQHLDCCCWSTQPTAHFMHFRDAIKSN